MATGLRDVLTLFETAERPLTINEMARRLEITPGMLESMIDYWVRKGKLRDASTVRSCNTCGGAEGCPFVGKMPRRYVLADSLPVLHGCDPAPRTFSGCASCR